MDSNDYQPLEKLTKQMMIILERTSVEDDNYAPLKSAILLMGFIIPLDNLKVKIRGINTF